MRQKSIPGQPPRDIAIYLVHRFCCKTLPSVGKEFGITNYSTVSSVVQRVKVRYKRDKYLLKEIEIIKKRIVKGQKQTPFPFFHQEYGERWVGTG